MIWYVQKEKEMKRKYRQKYTYNTKYIEFKIYWWPVLHLIKHKWKQKKNSDVRSIQPIWSKVGSCSLQATIQIAKIEEGGMKNEFNEKKC